MCDHENDCMDWSDEDYFLCKVSAGFPTVSNWEYLGSIVRHLYGNLINLSPRLTQRALRRLLKLPVPRMSSIV